MMWQADIGADLELGQLCPNYLPNISIHQCDDSDDRKYLKIRRPFTPDEDRGRVVQNVSNWPAWPLQDSKLPDCISDGSDWKLRTTKRIEPHGEHAQQPHRIVRAITAPLEEHI